MAKCQTYCVSESCASLDDDASGAVLRSCLRRLLQRAASAFAACCVGVSSCLCLTMQRAAFFESAFLILFSRIML